MSTAPRGTPLGGLLAVQTPSGPRFVLGGITAPGEVAFAAPMEE